MNELDEKKIITSARKVKKSDRDAINNFITLLMRKFMIQMQNNRRLDEIQKISMMDALVATLQMIQRNLK